MITKKINTYNKTYYSRPDVKQSHSKYMKEYYQKHKEQLLKKQSDYYIENKEKIKGYMKIYMRTYKKKLLRKNVVDPQSKVVDKLNKNKVSTVTDKNSNS